MGCTARSFSEWRRALPRSRISPASTSTSKHHCRDGRFLEIDLDFDLFSNTQVTTFGAKVSGCRAEKVNSLQTEVDGEGGLSGRSNGTPRRLPYEMNQDGRERCRSFQSLFAASTPKPCTHFCARDEIENLISSSRLTQVVKSQ